MSDTQPPSLGALFDAATTAAEFKGQATGEWRAGKGSLEAIKDAEKKQLAAEDAFTRRGMQVCPEEMGVDA